MDNRLMRLRNEALDVLNENRETTHSFLDEEQEKNLQSVVDSIGDSRVMDGDLTPGQRQALEVADPLLDEVTFDEVDDLSPGQRAARSI